MVSALSSPYSGLRLYPPSEHVKASICEKPLFRPYLSRTSVAGFFSDSSFIHPFIRSPSECAPSDGVLGALSFLVLATVCLPLRDCHSHGEGGARDGETETSLHCVHLFTHPAWVGEGCLKPPRDPVVGPASTPSQKTRPLRTSRGEPVSQLALHCRHTCEEHK